jgi:isoquinoline 1-oxidoreductase beta subunit
VGQVIDFDATEALAMPGVVKVKAIRAGVVVLADSYWRAQKARAKLKIEWDRGVNDGVSSEQFYADYRALADTPGLLAEDIGDAIGALDAAETAWERGRGHLRDAASGSRYFGAHELHCSG